tara:strand:+ start:1407 stop:2879 length:1473 start_codon:yes stop_codon:yes gene_type:complete
MTSIFREVTAVSRNNGRQNELEERNSRIVTSSLEDSWLDEELAGITTDDHGVAVFRPIVDLSQLSISSIGSSQASLLTAEDRSNCMVPLPAPQMDLLERNNPHAVDTRARRIANCRGEYKTNKWVFTINNYTNECANYLMNDLQDNGSIGYCAAGKEICPKTGTPHIQGYIRFTDKKGKRMKTVIRVLGYYWSKNRPGHGCWPNLKPAIKGDMANKNYCGKECREGWFLEIGEAREEKREGQGARNDYHDTYDIIKGSTFSGEKEEDLAEKIPEHYLKHGKMVIRLRNLCQMRENPNGEQRAKGHRIIWIFGKTGRGKSHFVEAALEGKAYYMKGPGKWWDQYDMEEYLWLDDFRKDYFKFHYLLKVLDRYRLMTEYKGGYTRIRVHITYVTCPVHPAVMYGNRKDNADQLLRRIYSKGQVLEALEAGDDEAGKPAVIKEWSKEESYELLKKVNTGEVDSWGNLQKNPSGNGGQYAPTGDDEDVWGNITS